MTTWLYDVESRSRCDLKARGGRAYWSHPSTEVLCIVLFNVERGAACTTPHAGAAYCDDCAPLLWLPGDPCPVGFDDVLVAHNAVGFDRFAIARVGWRPISDPLSVDSSQLARTAGLPGSLDALGMRWLGIPKDKDASRFTVGLSTCRRPTKKRPGPEGRAYTADEWRELDDEQKRARGVQADVTIEALTRVVEYCFSDVEIMIRAYPRLAEWRALEAPIVTADRVINDRGIGFDAPLARRLLAEDARNTDRAIEEAAAALSMSPERVRAIAGSPAQFGASTGLPDAQKGTLDDYLATADPFDDDPVAHLCRARRALASIARGKLGAGLARVCPDGRLRDSVRYFAAHTGRWGGSGLQPHNMPRPADMFEGWTGAQIDTLAREVTSGREASPAEIDLLLRAILCAAPGRTLVTADYSGVESMALAVCAGDTAALEVTARGLKNYSVMASKIFGVPYADIGKGAMYAVGKMAELACQYGMGAGKFAAQARAMGVDLDAVGVTAADVVDAWRVMHAPVVQFWREIEDAFRAAVKYGETTSVSCFEISPSADGRDVAAFLPSGRPIVYTGMRLASDDRFVRPGEHPRQSLAYQGAYATEWTYGGKLVENLIQALCREFLAWSLPVVEAAGLPVVLHVHDEIVCEVPEARGAEALAKLEHAMTKGLPSWAADFPLKTAGHIGRRYRK